jgi:hypothetical protein
MHPWRKSYKLSEAHEKELKEIKRIEHAEKIRQKQNNYSHEFFRKNKYDLID